MKNNVKPVYFKKLMQLQEQNGKGYSYAHIGKRIGISGQACGQMFDDPKGVKFESWNRLLDFFEEEGMPLEFWELFTNERPTKEDPPDD